MYLVFLDEFGHIGPFVSRDHPQFNTSPVFGLAGYWLHYRQVRSFSDWFYELKASTFSAEIESSSKIAATWEKKGNQLFTSGRAYKTKRLGFSLLNQVAAANGSVFFHGVEKHLDPDQSNPTGLYYSVLKRTIRELDAHFNGLDEDFMIVIDEHQSRAQLLESAMRTMHDPINPARRLIEPPYHVESHLYSTIQAADWISSLVGPLATFQCRPSEFADRAWAERYFGQRLDRHSLRSRIRSVKTDV